MASSFGIEEFPVFSVCSKDEVRDIKDYGRYITALKNETVHRPIESCTSVGFILSGMLRMTRIFSSGKELVIRSLPAGEMYGELVSFSAARYPCWKNH